MKNYHPYEIQQETAERNQLEIKKQKFHVLLMIKIRSENLIALMPDWLMPIRLYSRGIKRLY